MDNRYVGHDPPSPRLGLRNLAIVPLQDVLGLGQEARMNYPGKPEGNWQWRRRLLTAERAGRLR